MSAERAAQLGIKPMGKFIAFAYAGCDPEEMGIGPDPCDSQGVEDGWAFDWRYRSLRVE